MIPLLETERLVLREITERDFDAVHSYASDLEVVQYVPWGPNTEQDTHDFLAHCLLSAAADERMDYVFGVEFRDDPGVVGTCGLYVKNSDPGQAMLGYAYGKPAWGRGIATEAALVMVEMGFDVLGLRRIWAACDPDNTGSRRVLEKVGMQIEGLLREDTVIRGEVRDTLLWGILEPEWQSKTRSRGASNDT